ncbi:putative cytochrome P450, EF-Hand 1, calcium-binding protein [Rosa chinensis]|uniref:Putative cytochrome P450, EF-Hand 1, calcium-binding protein n=1 Tax=Rosa chinensis TaxID=74649 RepID=A0A2P6R2G3_ROSCH|nr:cytochrome P450 CYP749A22 [Rosa chinensis]PRQ40598.1 putative cytochrome P450, EF-Hand 1, calcium-binding protein [Rosa chinensis]
MPKRHFGTNKKSHLTWKPITNILKMGVVILVSSFLCVFLLPGLIKIVYKLWWTPTRIQKRMASQGIRGPSYRLIYGNTKEISSMHKEAMSRPLGLSHDILSYVQPHIHSWTNLYGKTYLQWHGSRAQLVIQEPELCKEILNNKDGAYPKIGSEDFVKKLLGDGLVTIVESEKWAKLRRIATHAFHGESLKTMIPDMIASAETMVERWKNHEGKEIEVFEEFRLFTSEVIAKTAFGSSYVEGELIFQMLMKLAFLLFKNALTVKVPGISKISKSCDEIESERLEKGIRDSITEIVKNREKKPMSDKEDNFGSDFLGLLLKAHHDANQSQRITVDDLVDDCKTFYFAGQETTNTLLCWTVLLLALHIDWQEEARKEVLQLFGKQNPNPDGISKLKTMNMIINETLRLYPPVVGLVRKAGREVTLGKVIIPADLELFVSVLALHHEPQIWGPDVHLFKPERFSEGVAKATKNNIGAFMPFGLGPRTCVGLNFATTEAKIAMSMILQRYSFSLSPAYVHSPFQFVTVRPQHGVQVILQPI